MQEKIKVAGSAYKNTNYNRYRSLQIKRSVTDIEFNYEHSLYTGTMRYNGSNMTVFFHDKQWKSKLMFDQDQRDIKRRAKSKKRSPNVSQSSRNV